MAEADDEPLEVYWDDLRVARLRADPEPTPAEALRALVDPGDMVIGTSAKRILVIIKPNGELVFGPDYTPNEASMVFWEAMGQARLAMEDRLLLIQHMESILVRLGRQDMECERIRRLAAEEQDPIIKAQRTQEAELAIGRLNMVAHQAIELGRGLIRRPEIPMPAVPERMPEAIRRNPNTEYQGQAGLPPEEEPLGPVDPTLGNDR